MDTDTFKAHSVRGASTTAALAKGGHSLIGILNPHFRDFITALKRRMSMPAPD